MLTYNCPKTKPVLENLASTMRCGLFTNAKNEILLIYYGDLLETVDYIQYNPASQTFSIIYENGQIQILGLTMQDRINANLINGTEVTMARMQNEKLVSSQRVIFLIESR